MINKVFGINYDSRLINNEQKPLYNVEITSTDQLYRIEFDIFNLISYLKWIQYKIKQKEKRGCNRETINMHGKI